MQQKKLESRAIYPVGPPVVFTRRVDGYDTVEIPPCETFTLRIFSETLGSWRTFIFTELEEALRLIGRKNSKQHQLYFNDFSKGDIFLVHRIHIECHNGKAPIMVFTDKKGFGVSRCYPNSRIFSDIDYFGIESNEPSHRHSIYSIEHKNKASVIVKMPMRACGDDIDLSGYRKIDFTHQE